MQCNTMQHNATLWKAFRSNGGRRGLAGRKNDDRGRNGGQGHHSPLATPFSYGGSPCFFVSVYRRSVFHCGAAWIRWGVERGYLGE